MEEARRGTSTVTRRARLINTKRNNKAIIIQMEIIRLTMGFTLLTEIGCVSITRAVGLIPCIPMASTIHGPTV